MNWRLRGPQSAKSGLQASRRRPAVAPTGMAHGDYGAAAATVPARRRGPQSAKNGLQGLAAAAGRGAPGHGPRRLRGRRRNRARQATELMPLPSLAGPVGLAAIGQRWQIRIGVRRLSMAGRKSRSSWMSGARARPGPHPSFRDRSRCRGTSAWHFRDQSFRHDVLPPAGSPQSWEEGISITYLQALSGKRFGKGDKQRRRDEGPRQHGQAQPGRQETG